MRRAACHVRRREACRSLAGVVEVPHLVAIVRYEMQEVERLVTRLHPHVPALRCVDGAA